MAAEEETVEVSVVETTALAVVDTEEEKTVAVETVADLVEEVTKFLTYILYKTVRKLTVFFMSIKLKV